MNLKIIRRWGTPVLSVDFGIDVPSDRTSLEALTRT